MLNAVDSLFEYVKSRMATINPARVLGGLVDAQDWPPQNVQMEALYLIALPAVPVGKETYSAAIPILMHTLQWTWMVQGTDLAQAIIGANRGDRYRKNMQIRQDLLAALWPNFAEKKSWSVVGQAVVGASLNPVEFMIWTPVQFLERIDKASGLLYGTATIHLTDMESPILS